MENLSNIKKRFQANTVSALVLTAVCVARDAFYEATEDEISTINNHADAETKQILADLCNELDSARDRLAYLVGTTSLRGGIN